MGSAILLVIVGAWACVLVPMLLRRHDRALAASSADRFATAMRVLSRRTASGTDRRYVVMPRRPVSAAGLVRSGAMVMTSPYDEPAPRGTRAPGRPGAGPRASTTGAARGRPTSHGRPTSRARVPASHEHRTPRPRPDQPRGNQAHTLLLARRRRVLTGLFVLTASSALVAVLLVSTVGVLAVLTGVALLGYLAHLRREAQRAALRARRRRRSVALAADFAERPLPVRRAGQPMVRRIEPGAVETAAVAPASAAHAQRYDRPVAGSAWRPVPVPKPTYAGPPTHVAASAPPRVVDLTRPGAFDAASARLGLRGDDAESDLEFEDDEFGLDTILESRRAVGG